jgi:hypothetical protein
MPNHEILHKISPNRVELVYVSALELCLRTKMIFEHFYVVSRYTFHLIKALIRIE